MCLLVKMLFQVQTFCKDIVKRSVWQWNGGFFSDCLWSWTQTIFPVKHLTSVSPFFPSFSVNQRWSCESLLTKRVLLHFLGQAWATSGLGAKADEMMQLKCGTACQLHFQRNGSMANLHLRAALLPVTIKQREGSLEIGCFALKQYAWASDSGAISTALRSRHPQPQGKDLTDTTARDSNSLGEMALQGRGRFYPPAYLPLLFTKQKKIASDFFSPFAYFHFINFKMDMTQPLIVTVSHAGIRLGSLFGSRNKALPSHLFNVILVGAAAITTSDP